MNLILLPLLLVLIAAWPTSLPAQECACKELVIAVDVGHGLLDPGAISARGKPEFEFNLVMGAMIKDQLIRAGYLHTFAIVNPANLRERVKIAEEKMADLFLSIHHDSVQPNFLKAWEFNGKSQKYADMFRGYSVLVSTGNMQYSKSLAFAKLVGRNFLDAGFTPAYHHSKKVPGGRHTMLDENLGVYQFDNLVVLKYTIMPAVLIEFGVIVHRDEELRLLETETREKMARGVVEAVNAFNNLDCPVP
ncbi:MAG: N-acetylmuramoyl-L-alanine amidase [Magnetococcales bacterium]|nr:N-acetylmuramoyl-L-alanine amidase [Magnetococcales bacterium]